MASEDIIHKSSYPDIQIPETNLTRFVFDRALPLHAEKVAMIDGITGRKYTYAQLFDAIKRVSFGLHKRGFKAGDVLCIFAPNVLEYAVAFHAVAYMGGTVSTANPLYTADELAPQLATSEATFLVTLGMFLEKAKQADKQNQVKEFFTFDPVEGATPFAELMKESGEVPEPKINAKHDVVALPSSSGTTGLPKGVMLTHYNLVANILQCESMETHKDEETFLGILPFFHIYGLTVILNYGLAKGSTVVVLPKFEPESFLKAIQTYKVTTAHLVPPIILFLAKHPVVDKFDLSSLYCINSGAAPLGPDLQTQAAERLKLVCKQGYGMTELSPVSHMVPINAKLKPGSVGFLISNMECKIVDVETKKSLGVGKANVGEIWLRGPNVMKGYHKVPTATAETLDQEGFLHTGDIGYVDEEGHYFIVDRLKELIKYKGFQVPPAELEDLILSHPSVADTAVIGVPNEEAGELPRAFVVLKPNQTLAEEDLVRFVDGKVAPHMKLRGGVAFVDTIPKSPAGKILRRILKAQVKPT